MNESFCFALKRQLVLHKIITNGSNDSIITGCSGIFSYHIMFDYLNNNVGQLLACSYMENL